MAFSLEIASNKYLSIEDLSYISSLVDTNIPFTKALQLLKNKNNAKIFDKINGELTKGKLIEEIIPKYLSKQIKDYLIPLLKTLPFTEALDLTLQFNDCHKKSQNELISSIAYPLILLFITISALYLFDLYGMDTIFELISSFSSSIKNYQGFRLIFKIAINVIYFLILLLSLLVLYFSRPNKIVILYIASSKYLPNSLINIYCCQEFISLFLVCCNKGYKTKQALAILKKMKSKPIVSFLAFHMDEALLEGESLKQATKGNYYDLTLSRFIKIANYTNSFEQMLERYVQLSKEKITRKMKQYTLTIQLCTYLFIGIIVVFIYQILFMPMQALSMY